jgi:DNA-binding HxlR family transcriptional regulator
MFEIDGKAYVCFLDLGVEIIKGKWKAVIMCRLEDGPMRFLELQRTLEGVSQKVLNEKLKELEKDGLIGKTTYPEVPPRVEFYLTEKGISLMPALKELEKWTSAHYEKYNF